MIDRVARQQAGRILKRVALGRVANFAAENEFMDLHKATRDPIVFALFRTLREMTGDKEVLLSAVFAKGSQMRKRLCRWIFFLQTDLEYEWPQERLAPGIRDLYRVTWRDKLLGKYSPVIRSNNFFCGQGDYHVWPFRRETDLTAARRSQLNSARSAANRCEGI